MCLPTYLLEEHSAEDLEHCSCFPDNHLKRVYVCVRALFSVHPLDTLGALAVWQAALGALAVWQAVRALAVWQAVLLKQVCVPSLSTQLQENMFLQVVCFASSLLSMTYEY